MYHGLLEVISIWLGIGKKEKDTQIIAQLVGNLIFFKSSHMLIDLRPKDRLYIIYMVKLRDNPSFAFLDRFLYSISWEKEFPGCISNSLFRFQSDHNALILKTTASNHINMNQIIKYDKN
jgi:hypothetical protein